MNLKCVKLNSQSGQQVPIWFLFSDLGQGDPRTPWSLPPLHHGNFIISAVAVVKRMVDHLDICPLSFCALLPSFVSSVLNSSSSRCAFALDGSGNSKSIMCVCLIVSSHAGGHTTSDKALSLPELLFVMIRATSDESQGIRLFCLHFRYCAWVPGLFCCLWGH